MPAKPKFIGSLAFFLFTFSACAGSLVYVVTDSQQFGTVNLATGAFHQIGPDTPEGQATLVPGPNGSLLSLTFSGNLESINPATGATSVIGATGLGGSTGFALSLAEVGGALYGTDSSNNLYSVNAANGVSHLIGPTGIPGVPPRPAEFDESLYGTNGKLFATFDAFITDPATLQLTTVVSPNLYQIDPSTGLATLLAPTILQIIASVAANDTFYGFKGSLSAPNTIATSQVVTLDLANGNTSFVANIDPAATGILGATPAVPEPASLALAGIGFAVIAVLKRRLRQGNTR